MPTPSALELGDFTVTPRTLPLALVAAAIGILSAAVAVALLRLIGLFTNLFYFQRIAFDMASPAGNHLGLQAILVPVGGALAVGLLARFGSERIRGHGIPEAIEAILIRGSRVEPKVALLKPLSAAISIGSGGPFGAEGPIIMTGGAFGSVIAQLFHLTSAERKTLLVATTLSYAFTALTMRRSILTEKVARRGYHLSREYAIDPMEILFVREAMCTGIVALPHDLSPAELQHRILHAEDDHRRQRLYPVVDAERRVLGVVPRGQLNGADPAASLDAILLRDPVVAHPDETLQHVVHRMAETGVTRMPVVSRDGARTLVGMIALADLLKANALNLEAERRRERMLPLRLRWTARQG